ncbi:DUF397 domain-containing protein [Nocardiopsis sp. NPDC006198]|uniref:DUF397 domain-containing protein n=1 Tax=Nocardiopsis sp. NPDC006198 TaxID=3154472 RepID=UPI0033A91191
MGSTAGRSHQHQPVRIQRAARGRPRLPDECQPHRAPDHERGTVKDTPRRNWHKSPYSANEGECIEVSEGPQTLVRDTAHREHGHLTLPAREWAAVLSAIR